MTELQIADAKSKLSARINGDLRNLFYRKSSGLPKKNVLLTNRQILEKLGILEIDPNSLEYEGLLRFLGVGLAQLRKQAKDSGIPWIDVEIVQEGARVARHGFSDDLDKVMLNADKFDDIAQSREQIAKQTRAIAERQRKLLAA